MRSLLKLHCTFAAASVPVYWKFPASGNVDTRAGKILQTSVLEIPRQWNQVSAITLQCLLNNALCPNRTGWRGKVRQPASFCRAPGARPGGCSDLAMGVPRMSRTSPSSSTTRQRYSRSPVMRTTISSKCERSLGRGRRWRSRRGIAGPNFSTQRRTVSYDMSSPRSARSSSTSR